LAPTVLSHPIQSKRTRTWNLSFEDARIEKNCQQQKKENMDEFNFDESQLNLSETELANMDKEFLNSMQRSSADANCDDENDAFTFWFLIILLLVFVFFLVLGIIMLVKGRQRRYQYALVGYRAA